jgi:hypothetical protein
LPSEVMRRIKKEGEAWVLAGAKNLAELMGWFCLFRGLSLFIFSFWPRPYPVCSFYINILAKLLPRFKKEINEPVDGSIILHSSHGSRIATLKYREGKGNT